MTMSRLAALTLCLAFGLATSASASNNHNNHHSHPQSAPVRSVPASYPKKPVKLMEPPDGCTSIVVDPAASTDGGMTTHTNDCKNCDFRLSKVPARDWPEGSERPIVRVRLQYPRYIGDLRGETYKLENTDVRPYPWALTPAIGHIPQVSHTFAYIDGLYGIVNEHQVAMGESTCAARLVAAPVFDGGKALFDMSELSRVAMERARTAREAISIMGELAEKYGFYGAEWKGALAEGEAGEAMTVTDPKESFVFHILPDNTGASAVWVAQKVPTGHISVVSNSFMIGEIDFDDHENFLYSKNIKKVAQEMDFWQPEYGPFHFAEIYGEQVFYEIYCSRRTWRIFDLVAPGLKLQPNHTVTQLPFSVKPDSKLSKFDLFKFQRDHYEGSQFDLTTGLQSGPYGNPNRYDRGEGGGLKLGLLMQGTFERGISLYRTIYSSVTVSRDWVRDELAMMWWGPAAPHATFYSPLYATSHILPEPYTHGSLFSFDRTTLWWASTSIGGWMERMFMHISKDVYAEQARIEAQEAAESREIEKKVTELLEKEQRQDAYDLLTAYQNENANKQTSYWWNLFERLIEKFHDGYRVDDFHAETINPTSVFYPLDWLNAVGYFKSPPDFNKTDWQYTITPPTHHPRPTDNPVMPPRDVMGLDPADKKVQQVGEKLQDKFENSKQSQQEKDADAAKGSKLADSAGVAAFNGNNWGFFTWFFLVTLLLGVGAVFGFFVGQKVALRNSGYTPIGE